MATGPAHRRQGVAGSVLNALSNEALDRGVDRMYLAVMAANDPATVLYRNAGFTVAHEYCYFADTMTA